MVTPGFPKGGYGCFFLVSAGTGGQHGCTFEAVVVRCSDDSEASLVTEQQRRGGVGGWVVALLLLGLACFAGYVGYRKWASAHPAEASAGATHTAGASHNPRLITLLRAGYQHLDAGRVDAAIEQFQKASGIDEKHPEVQQALCAARVLQVEGSALRLRAAIADSRPQPQRDALLQQLDKDAQRARGALARARGVQPQGLYRSHLNGLEHQLNSWLALAYRSGDKAHRAALMAQLKGDPHAQLLRALLAGANDAPAAGASASPSASADAAPTAAAPTTAAATAQHAAGARPPRRRERPYEFDEEPDVGDLAGPDELAVPKQAAPAAAPVSDLPPE